MFVGMKFEEMNIDQRMMELIHKLGITEPTEIQEKTIPYAMQGKDVVGQSMTGSGKTLVFAVSIAHNAKRGEGVQALVLVPTRELANQVGDYMHSVLFGGIRVCKVFGGVSINPQISELRHAEVVVGTPGRILDHINRNTLNLKGVRTLVLDEADRMLDMGFIDDIRRIMTRMPEKRQNLLFSATVPDEIHRLIRTFMREPVSIKAQTLVSKHKLKEIYYDANDNEKVSLLIHLVKQEKPYLAMIFCGTKRTTDVVTEALRNNGVEAEALHGDIPQDRRMRVMASFHKCKPRVLVATDVASRGLDISDVSHIFNFDVPRDADSYTHRVGRTARIGRDGKAITLLTRGDHEAFRRIMRVHRDIEKLDAGEFPKLKIMMGKYRNEGRMKSRFGRRW